MKYTKNNTINVSIDERRINSLLNFKNKQKEKLKEFSHFLNSINLINTDIEENYENILKNVDSNTIIYVDPPYHNESNGYRNYQKLFSEDNHMKLKVFLDKIYKKGTKWLKSNYGYKQQINHVFKNC